MNVLNECRVCFETTDQNLMVSPCHCRGSMACIHLQCLKNCIEMSGQQKCGICGQNWLGIEILKKRKSFTDFLNEKRFQKFMFFFILFGISITILVLIMRYKLGSPDINWIWIILPYYFMYLLFILQISINLLILVGIQF